MSEQPPPPLAGLRVLDHGHVWAGPLLGRSLSEAGELECDPVVSA